MQKLKHLRPHDHLPRSQKLHPRKRMFNTLMLRSPHRHRFLRPHRPNDPIRRRFSSRKVIQLDRIDPERAVSFYQGITVGEVGADIGCRHDGFRKVGIRALLFSLSDRSGDKRYLSRCRALYAPRIKSEPLWMLPRSCWPEYSTHS